MRDVSLDITVKELMAMVGTGKTNRIRLMCHSCFSIAT